MSVKLCTKNTARFGQRLALFAVGIVNISPEGIIEVENEEIAKQVEETHDEFFIVGGKKEKGFDVLQEKLKPKIVEDELNHEEENSLTSEEKDELMKSLANKKIDELRLLAKPFPKKDWRSLNENDLRNYLKDQLK